MTARELFRRGCEIVERNYHCRYGEIDIIAREGNTLVFVEVRSRRSSQFMSPGESVDERKQGKLVLTAQHYLASNGLDVFCRFDVSEVLFENGKPVSVEITQNAFGEG